MQAPLLLLLALPLAPAAPVFELGDTAGLVRAGAAGMRVLQQFFAANSGAGGAWTETLAGGRRLVAWAESGECLGAAFARARLGGDAGARAFADANARLFDAAGRRSDEAAWWGLAVATAAEAYGVDAVIPPDNRTLGLNPTYFSVANKTFQDVWAGWDQSTCAGGIFWSKIRDPNSDQRPFFKATITNVLAMELAARLYRLTNDLNFKIKFDAIFAWLKTTGIVAFDYTVYDGLNSNECRLVLPQVYSYNSGVLLSALSIMYKATNETFYINEASSIFNAIVRDFTTANVLDREPSCLAGVALCKSPTGYYWPVYKGIADLYTSTTSKPIQVIAANVLTESAKVNFATRCDDNWYCVRNLPPTTQDTMLNGTNPRDQFETMFLLNALLQVSLGAEIGGGIGAGSVDTPLVGATQTIENSFSSSSSSSSNSPSSTTNVGAIVGGVIGGIAALGLLVAFCCYKKRSTNAKRNRNLKDAEHGSQLRQELAGDSDSFLVSSSIIATKSVNSAGYSNLGSVPPSVPEKDVIAAAPVVPVTAAAVLGVGGIGAAIAAARSAPVTNESEDVPHPLAKSSDSVNTRLVNTAAAGIAIVANAEPEQEEGNSQNIEPEDSIDSDMYPQPEVESDDDNEDEDDDGDEIDNTANDDGDADDEEIPTYEEFSTIRSFRSKKSGKSVRFNSVIESHSPVMSQLHQQQSAESVYSKSSAERPGEDLMLALDSVGVRKSLMENVDVAHVMMYAASLEEMPALPPVAAAAAAAAASATALEPDLPPSSPANVEAPAATVPIMAPVLENRAESIGRVMRYAASLEDFLPPPPKMTPSPALVAVEKRSVDVPPVEEQSTAIVLDTATIPVIIGDGTIAEDQQRQQQQTNDTDDEASPPINENETADEQESSSAETGPTSDSPAKKKKKKNKKKKKSVAAAAVAAVETVVAVEQVVVIKATES